MSIFKSIGKVLYNVATTGLAVIAHPVMTVKELVTEGNISHSKQRVEGESAGQLLVGGVANTLLAVAPFTSAIKGVVTKAVTTAFTKSPIISSTATILGAGVLVSSKTATKTVATAIANAPEALFGTGEKIGGVIEGVTKVGDITEPEWYRIARSLGLGAGIALLASGAVYLGYKYYNGKLQKATEEKITEAEKVTEKVLDTGQTTITPQKAIDTGIPTEAPLPEMTTITTGAKKRYRRAKAKEKPSVRQSVRVNVITSAKSSGLRLTKNYLNKEVLAY